MYQDKINMPGIKITQKRNFYTGYNKERFGNLNRVNIVRAPRNDNR
ncbi:MAG: hypothetical protein CM15mV118_410 [uncultured marine virus]|nr:MAG: hypothetical protein CM15mV118_410 [uncultured marine virus]